MPSVLFVCTANQFRSPLAAALFQKLLGEKGLGEGWQVGSAGTWAREGRPALPGVVSAARDLGLDLEGHRAARLDGTLLAAYDLTLVMQASQKEALRSEFPALRDHVYLLARVAGRRAYDISDGCCSEQDIREVGGELERLLRRGMKRICALAAYLHGVRARALPLGPQ